MKLEITKYAQALLKTPPEKTDFKIGDKVTFINDYGVHFNNLTVIGYSDDILYRYGKFIHLDSDSYWYPHSPDQLTLEQVQQ